MRAGDESAFAAQAERYRRGCRSCYRMLGSFEDSEDLVQETCAHGGGARASKSRSSFRAWLYQIATNACLDALRQPRRVLPLALGGWGPALPTLPPPTSLAAALSGPPARGDRA